MSALWRIWRAYRLRWKRRYLLARAIRRRRVLRRLQDRSAAIRPRQILCFSCVRNEALRLPHFLDHHRGLGVDHFLIVDNDSRDGTRDLLLAQPDVSLWHTTASYRKSRFGMDWLGWLLFRYGHGHWCLTLDADELLIYPHHDRADLKVLTRWLDRRGWRSFRTLTLDLYPEGPLGELVYRAGQDPLEVLPYFDAGPYTDHPRDELQTLLTRGGARARCFFAREPERAPTMNKTPLVLWNRRFAYLDSTHSMLPPRLNRSYPTPDNDRPTGALLHTKFLHTILEKSAEEKERREHFFNSALYEDYYDALIAAPTLWYPDSVRFAGWDDLVRRGMIRRGAWRDIE